MFQYLFVIYPHAFLLKKKETKYPEIAINNCSDGTFSFIDDWPLIYNQAIHLVLFFFFYYTLLPNQMNVFKGMNQIRF